MLESYAKNKGHDWSKHLVKIPLPFLFLFPINQIVFVGVCFPQQAKQEKKKVRLEML